MPLAIAPCQIHEIAETRALHSFVREQTSARKAERPAVTDGSVLDKLRAETEHLQKRADLEFMDKAVKSAGFGIS